MASKKVKMIYIGRRLNGQSLICGFVHNGEELFFKNIKYMYCEIGREYWGQKTKTGYQMHSIPKPVDANEEVKQTKVVSMWFAEQCDAENTIREQRALKKIAKNERLENIIKSMGYLLKDLDLFETEAVVKHIMNQARKAKYK